MLAIGTEVGIAVPKLGQLLARPVIQPDRLAIVNEDLLAIGAEPVNIAPEFRQLLARQVIQPNHGAIRCKDLLAIGAEVGMAVVALKFRQLLARPVIQPNHAVTLEHGIQDARTNPTGTRRVVSRRMQYVEIDPEGKAQNAGYAPYLNYRPLPDEEKSVV